MTRPGRLLAAGLLLAVAAAGLWSLRSAQLQRREERRQALFAYVHGPLSDLLEGESDGRALLNAARRRRLTAGELKRLRAAADRVAEAARAASDPYAPWAVDRFFEPLQGGLHWHKDLAQLATDWAGVAARPELLEMALQADQGLRRSLASPLAHQKEIAATQLRLDKASILELNAMIYTLREDAQD